MSSFEEKTSFNGLKAQNQRLVTELEFANKCLNVLIGFKNVFNRIIDVKSERKLLYLKEEDIQELEELNEEYDNVLTDEQIKSEVNEENNELFVSKNTVFMKSLIQSTNQSLNYKPLPANQPIIISQSNGSAIQGLPGIQSNQSFIRNSTNILETQQIVLNNGVVVKIVPQTQTQTTNLCLESFPSDQIPAIAGWQIVNHQNNQYNVSPESTLKTLKPIFASNPPLKMPISGWDKQQSISEETAKTSSQTTIQIASPVPEPSLINNELENTSKNESKSVLKQPLSKERLEKRKNTQKTLDLILKDNEILNRSELSLKCTINDCNKIFETKEMIKLHQKESHNTVSLFAHYITTWKCGQQLCGQLFANKFMLKDHILSAHTKESHFKCEHPNCGKSHKTSRALRLHQFEYHSGDFSEPTKCSFNGCNYTTTVRKHLRTHKRTHFKVKNIVCTECGKRLVNKQSLENHMKTQHNATKVDPIVCPEEGCSKLVNPNYLKTHLKLHSKKEYLSCDYPECKFKHKQKSAVEQHKRNVHTDYNFVCSWPGCGNSFKNNFTLKRHWKKHFKRKITRIDTIFID